MKKKKRRRKNGEKRLFFDPSSMYYLRVEPSFSYKDPTGPSGPDKGSEGEYSNGKISIHSKSHDPHQDTSWALTSVVESQLLGFKIR